MLSMGKSTISMAIFNSKLLVNYRRVISMAMGQYGPCVDRWNIQEIESLKDVLEVLQGWAKHEAGWSSPRDPRLAVVAKRGAEVERLPLLGGLEHEWTEWIICPIIMGIVTPTSSSSIISSIYHPYIYISLWIQTLSEKVLNPPNYSKLYPKYFLRSYLDPYGIYPNQ